MYKANCSFSLRKVIKIGLLLGSERKELNSIQMFWLGPRSASRYRVFTAFKTR